MGALSYVVDEVVRNLFRATNVSTVSVRQKASEQREGKTMAVKLVAGTSQFLFVPFNAQRLEQSRTGVAGYLFQVTAQG